MVPRVDPAIATFAVSEAAHSQEGFLAGLNLGARR
jgi:hypothetical protein